MIGNESERLVELLEMLTGQKPPLCDVSDLAPCFPKSGLGYSQLNELLLLLGYDRITHSFFQFLVDGTLDYRPGCAVLSIVDLESGVERARRLSLLFFGNVKFGFKKLARDADQLAYYYALTQPLDSEILKQRHNPVHPIDPIPVQETYFLGYIVQKQIEAKLAKDPKDEAALSEQRVLEGVRRKGIRNQHSYLV